ncbi:uncharacterized protein [Ambystoma mexicanum]|uniref:uncharacterized protein n=1 Tax=Ambystoma mexicanum TaxID=8296 RepID=UPI0037E9BC7B
MVGRKRNVKFSDEELSVLVEAIMREEAHLFENLMLKNTAHTRASLWDAVHAKVNAVALRPRSLADLKRRWNVLKRRVRSKITEFRKKCLAGATGPPPRLILLPWEEKTLSLIMRESDEVGVIETGIQESGVEGGIKGTDLHREREEGDCDEKAGPMQGPFPPVKDLYASISLGGLKNTTTLEPMAMTINEDHECLDHLKLDDVLPVIIKEEEEEEEEDEDWGNHKAVPERPNLIEIVEGNQAIPGSSENLPIAASAVQSQVALMARIESMERSQKSMIDNGREQLEAIRLVARVVKRLDQHFERDGQLRQSALNEAHRKAREDAREAHREAREDAREARREAREDALEARQEARADACEIYRYTRKDASEERREVRASNRALFNASLNLSRALNRVSSSNGTLTRQMLAANEAHAQSFATLIKLLQRQEQTMSQMAMHCGTATIPSSALQSTQQFAGRPKRCSALRTEPRFPLSPEKRRKK